MGDDSSKPTWELIINEELVKRDQSEFIVLSAYEVDALLRAVSNSPCHLSLVYSTGHDSHITKAVKHRIFMNLSSIYSLSVKNLDQYEYVMNRPASSPEEFAEFLIRSLRRL